MFYSIVFLVLLVQFYLRFAHVLLRRNTYAASIDASSDAGVRVDSIATHMMQAQLAEECKRNEVFFARIDDTAYMVRCKNEPTEEGDKKTVVPYAYSMR